MFESVFGMIVSDVSVALGVTAKSHPLRAHGLISVPSNHKSNSHFASGRSQWQYKGETQLTCDGTKIPASGCCTRGVGVLVTAAVGAC